MYIRGSMEGANRRVATATPLLSAVFLRGVTQTSNELSWPSVPQLQQPQPSSCTNARTKHMHAQQESVVVQWRHA